MSFNEWVLENNGYFPDEMINNDSTYDKLHAEYLNEKKAEWEKENSND